MAFFEGLLLGMATMLITGPVFFMLIKSSLQHGFRAGWSVATGIVVSDVAAAFLCSFGAIPFFEDPRNQVFLAAGGSALLMAMGLRYLLKRQAGPEAIGSIQARHYTAFFAKGFLVNFVNPFVFLIWVGVIGYAQATFGSRAEVALLVAGMLCGIYAVDMLKVLFAQQIARFIRPGVLVNVYRVIGLVMVGFSLRLVWHVLQQWP